MTVTSASEEKPSPGQDRRVWAGVILATLLFLAVISRRAWLGDDAHITFRVVDNFVHGYGLTWNVAERVQAYTHPLWFFVLTLGHLVTREFYWMPIAISVALSGLAIFLLARTLARSATGAALGLAALLLSKAYIDYSTSGLENPLSHLIIVLFFMQFFAGEPSPKWLGRLSLVASLGILNRMDLGLIFLPALLYGLYRVRSWSGARALLLGQIPFFLWEIFSTWYYGFPFPNTAYAKLNTGIDAYSSIAQGVNYVLDSLRFDPVTLVSILVGLLVCRKFSDRGSWLATLGGLLYIAYVVKVGGDFMSGRFFAAPLLCAAIAISRADIPTIDRVGKGFLFAIVLIAGLLLPQETTFQKGAIGDRTGAFPFNNGIADERAFYACGTSVLNYGRLDHLPDFPWVDEGIALRQSGQKVIVVEATGMIGLYGGPGLYIIDTPALGNALLARLPMVRNANWRIGHFTRPIPEGYIETVESGQNRLADPDLARYYDALSVIIRGDLFSLERLGIIARMNLGAYDALIDVERYRLFNMVRLNRNALSEKPRDSRAACKQDEPGYFTDTGIEISLGARVHDPVLAAQLSKGAVYQVEYLLDGAVLATQEVGVPLESQDDGDFNPLSIEALRAPEQAAAQGYNQVRIFPTRGQAPHCIGYLSTRGAE